MASRGGPRFSSANAGELDPDLSGRVDIKQYYSGGLAFHNVEPVPQSGFRQSPGSVDVAAVRGRMASAAYSGAVANLGPHASGTQTVWSATVPADTRAIDIAAIEVDAGTPVASVEINIGGVWTAVGGGILLSDTPKNRCVAFPPGTLGTVTAVRVRVTFAVSGTVSFGSITPMTESTSVFDRPRYVSLRHDSGDRYWASFGVGFVDIFLDDAFVAGVRVPLITEAVLPLLNFYAENATIGAFFRGMQPQRIRRAGVAQEWERDDWPFETIPDVDLGGTYATTDDVWEIFVNWQTNTGIRFQITIDGVSAASVYTTLTDGTTPAGADDADWAVVAGLIEDALQAIPGIGAGLTVTEAAPGGATRLLTVTFGGDLSGSEYQLSATVINTTEAACFASHITIGETDLEPLISVSRGYPGVTGLVQDRLAYGDFAPVRSAIAISQAGEYFKLGLEGTSPAGARLDKLRSGTTSEAVLAFKEATFLLVFTDQAVYFAANRTINRTDPLNYTVTSQAGIVPNTEAVDIAGKVYYAAQSDDEDDPFGHQILSGAYDEIGQKFAWNPESLLASHLTVGIIRTRRQKAANDKAAAKMWIMRSDGLVIYAPMIPSQEILGFCRWIAAGSGAVREIDVDQRNQVRVCVQRGTQLRHERLDDDEILHGVITRTADLAGVVAGLTQHEGRAVWAQTAAGYVLGPYTVASAEIDLGQHHAGDIKVGLWQPPKYESMPRYLVLPNDEIVKRPGRIHSAHINVTDTTSIAVGANGQPPQNVPLARSGDPGNAPTPARTEKLTVSGMLGMRDGTTLVITQTRPGRLRVRDFTIEEKL